MRACSTFLNRVSAPPDSGSATSRRARYTPSVRALLVALDLPTAAEVGAALQQGWPTAAVLYADSVEEARIALQREHIDVVLLGAPPAAGGLQICEDVCEHAEAPVLLIAERRGLIDSVRAAELGVSDFLWRPLTTREVVRRVQQAMDRARAPLPMGTLSALEAGSLRVDYAACTVTVDGLTVNLSPGEYALLYHLTRNVNSVLATGTLLAKVWGRRYVDETDVLHVHVERLRLKLAGALRSGPRIAGREGFGYAFEHRASAKV